MCFFLTIIAFYWIGAPAGEAKKGKMAVVSADRKTNTIRVEKSDYSRLTFYLNDTLVDLDKPVKVVFGDKVLFEGSLTRSPQTMLSTLNARGDLSYIFPAELSVTL